ncbi:uncharacterized protein LOC129366544 isoform X3 [Poeciliopsis prolifica]|uniref:uncharacterized protein LOC129366544 isoform X3 n=1 Tax=Poeciliopsis prolifica TaxID=188132 RepID=UPI0024139F7A|nr:uncharacterized protein LOC129366544 isoform X3 [Poeciliopsis prolifica]
MFITICKADMEGFDFNVSGLYISQRFANASGDITIYESCKDMPGVLIWYLSLQFTNMFLGIPANITVLWLIHKNKRDSSTSDIFIIHLAVLDVLFCLTPPLELANIVFLATSSTWLKDRRHRLVLAVLVWLIILAYASAKCVGNIVHFDLVYTVMILSTFAFMMFCNIAILWALKQSRPGRDTMHPVKKRASNLVLIILAIIVFNYFPSVAMFPFKTYFSQDVFRCYVHYVAFGLMDFSSTIQPILYLSKKKFPGRLNCCRTTTTTNETQTNSVSREIWTLSQPSQNINGGLS